MVRGGEFCVSFAFHMYGHHVGSLELVVEDQSGARTVEWAESGSQGRQWNTTQTTVTVGKQSTVSLGIICNCAELVVFGAAGPNCKIPANWAQYASNELCLKFHNIHNFNFVLILFTEEPLL